MSEVNIRFVLVFNSSESKSLEIIFESCILLYFLDILKFVV